MKILLMGPPACGKGTQGEKLSATMGIPLIVTGQLLRNLPKDNPEFAHVHKTMEKGLLVDNKFVGKLLVERTKQADCKAGFILDGWGRSADDLQIFNPGFDIVLLISISNEESLRRITGRRMCVTDGKFYNIHTLPPEEIKKCTGELIQREDDKEEVVKRRLDIYDTQTKRTIEIARSNGVLVEVDGMGAPEEIFGRVLSAIEQKLTN